MVFHPILMCNVNKRKYVSEMIILLLWSGYMKIIVVLFVIKKEMSDSVNVKSYCNLKIPCSRPQLHKCNCQRSEVNQCAKKESIG